MGCEVEMRAFMRWIDVSDCDDAVLRAWMKIFDVFGLLDFARRLKDGPKRGRDRLSDAALAKLSRCFPADARGTTRVVRAHSWRPEGSLRYQYQVRLICEALGDREEIVVTGARGEEAIRWQAGVQDSVTVDPVAP
jgi:hypothetical protein